MDQRQRITRSTDGFFISTRAYEGQPAQKLHNSEGKSAIAFTMTMFCTVRKSGTSSLQWPNFYNWKPAQSVLQHSCFWKPTNPWIHLPSLLSLLPFLCWFRSIAHLRLVWWSKKGNIRQYQFLLLFHSKKLYCFLSFFFFFLILFYLRWPRDLLWLSSIWQKSQTFRKYGSFHFPSWS